MKTTLLALPIILSALLAGCASNNTPKTTAQMGYIAFSQNQLTTTQGISNIRLQALQETASSLGAQGALAWRSTHINNTLTAEAAYLNEVFDFNSLLIGNHVLPPVLVQNSGSIAVDNANTIRIADKTYKIIAAAHVVSVAPTWRTYLWMNYQKPVQPNVTLLPRNEQEILIWNTYLKQGWKEGLIQANEIFSANLARLKQHYLGMILYRKLLSEHMISAPFVAKANLGITGNGHQISIGDQVLRITGHSALQTNAKKWQSVITQ